MAVEIIDLTKTQNDIFDGSLITVNPNMFGAIATSIDANYANPFSQFIEQADIQLIRWPGGTLAENGVVTPDGKASLIPENGIAPAYDLCYPELLHTDLLTDSSGASTGRPGLSTILEMAVERGAAFSMILPTERYTDNPEQAYDDVSAFLRKLFVEGAYNAGNLPHQITFDIGNENYDPASYGVVSVAMLAAVRDFRADYPSKHFDVALQAMQSGAQTQTLISVVNDSAYGSDYTNLLAEVDAIRVHSLKHSLGSIVGIEDRSPIYWAILRLNQAIDLARTESGRGPGETDLYVSAFTTTSADVQQGLKSGLPGASALISLFTGLLELGADSAAAWGIAAGGASETALSYVDESGVLQTTPQGAAYSLMAKNLIGMHLVPTSSIDGARGEEYNVYAFTSEDRSVIYVSANHLIVDKLELTIDISGALPLADYAMSVISASDGLSGVAVTSSRAALLNGSLLTFELQGDYEVVQIVVSHVGALPDGQMRFTGDELDNQITGTFEGELLRGLGGNDRLVGSGGNDTLDGGSGVDTADFRFTKQAMYIDLARGVARSSDGEVKLVSIERVICGDGSNTAIGSSGQDLIIGGLGNDNVVGANGNDRLEGRDGTDRLTGSQGNDVLLGGAGRDTLLGGADNDVLFGGRGADLLEGGVGNDSLEGGEQSDTLIGGAGADDFIFQDGFGRDVIQDFDGLAGDRIDLSGLSGHSQLNGFTDVVLAAAQIDNLLVIQVGIDQRISLVDVSIQQLQADFFVF